jgi:hypothetical protein
VIHSTQFLAAEGSRRPTTYYGERAGVGLAIVGTRTHSPQRVGLIGLGAGTFAAYGRPGDRYRFYAINPLCVEIVRREFTYLRDSQAEIDVTLGDGRLSLEREPSQDFEVLVVDAFTGDSIPVHLLTAEAFALYLRHLRRDGEDDRGTDWAVWVLITTDETRIALEKLGQPLQKIQTREGVNLWRDDYSSVFSVLR